MIIIRYTKSLTVIIIYRITETKASGRLIILHSWWPGLFEAQYHVAGVLPWDLLLVLISKLSIPQNHWKTFALNDSLIQQYLKTSKRWHSLVWVLLLVSTRSSKSPVIHYPVCRVIHFQLHALNFNGLPHHGLNMPSPAWNQLRC